MNPFVFIGFSIKGKGRAVYSLIPREKEYIIYIYMDMDLSLSPFHQDIEPVRGK